MKNIFFILLIITITNNCSISQQGIYDNYIIDNSINIAWDMCFINYNIGYISATQYAQPNWIGHLLKTTNGGVNWGIKYSTTFGYNLGGRFAFSISNSNIGYLIKQHEYTWMWGTSDGGENFTRISIDPAFQDYDGEPVCCISSDNRFYLIRKTFYKVTRILSFTSHDYYTFNDGNIHLMHIEISSTNNIVYVCGYKTSGSFNYPFFAESTDGGASFNTLNNFNGNQDPYNIGALYHMCIVNNGGVEVIKISGKNKLIEYNTNANSINELTNNNWVYGRKIRFSDMNNGFYINPDLSDNDDPLIETVTPGIFITTNNGQNWSSDFLPSSSASYPSRYYSYGNMLYFLLNQIIIIHMEELLILEKDD
jgi:hypothetical protein